MFTLAVTVTVALGAAVAAVAAARYRLSLEFVPAVIIFAVFAGTVPAWVDDVFARAWPAAACLFSAVVVLLAAGWAVRSRIAQLLPAWGRLLQREVEAEAAAEEDTDRPLQRGSGLVSGPCWASRGVSQPALRTRGYGPGADGNLLARPRDAAARPAR